MTIRDRKVVREYARRYREKHHDKVLAYRRKYASENREKLRRQDRTLRASKLEQMRAYGREWEARHREERRIKNRDWYRRNKEYERIKWNEWRSANPEVARAIMRRRRARVLEIVGHHTTEQWLSRVAYFGWKCWMCKEVLTIKNITQDHVIPLFRNGTDWASNLRPACLSCNSRKGSKPYYIIKSVEECR